MLLSAVERFKCYTASIITISMNRNKPGINSAYCWRRCILMMVIAQRQHKSMSAGNRSPVDMVQTDNLINYTMHIARDAG